MDIRTVGQVLHSSEGETMGFQLGFGVAMYRGHPPRDGHGFVKYDTEQLPKIVHRTVPK